jgi:hypothetical protein
MRAVRIAAIIIAAIVVFYGAIYGWATYWHGPAPAAWITAKVAAIDDPLIRQDVRLALAKKRSAGEAISRSDVGDQIETQHRSARLHRPAETQRGGLK